MVKKEERWKWYYAVTAKAVAFLSFDIDVFIVVLGVLKNQQRRSGVFERGLRP